MLGRLQMDIDECITIYKKLIVKVFKKREGISNWRFFKWTEGITDWIGKASFALGWNGHVYEDDPLEEAIKELIADKCWGNENASLLEENPACKTYYHIPLIDPYRAIVFKIRFSCPKRRSRQPCPRFPAFLQTSS